MSFLSSAFLEAPGEYIRVNEDPREFLENKFELMKILENKLESLKLQENQPLHGLVPLSIMKSHLKDNICFYGKKEVFRGSIRQEYLAGVYGESIWWKYLARVFGGSIWASDLSSDHSVGEHLIYNDNISTHREEKDQEGNKSLEIETLPLFPIHGGSQYDFFGVKASDLLSDHSVGSYYTARMVGPHMDNTTDFLKPPMVLCAIAKLVPGTTTFIGGQFRNVCVSRPWMVSENALLGSLTRGTKIERATIEYLEHLSIFLKVAEDDRVKKGKSKIHCPYKKCLNWTCYPDLKTIKSHLIENGFIQRYTCWNFHGEVKPKSNTSVSNCDVENNDSNNNNRDNLNDMLPNLEGNAAEKNHDKSQQLLVDSETPLYEGFTSLLEALHEMFPKAKLPSSTYQAKKLIFPMGMKIKKIDACPKDCMLYRDNDKDLHACRICGKSRYKKKKDTPLNPDDAKLLRWHAEERQRDGKIRHVADSLQWRNIDNEFKEFGDEIRNMRFGLSSDGINPFRNMTSRHSTWPKQTKKERTYWLTSHLHDAVGSYTWTMVKCNQQEVDSNAGYYVMRWMYDFVITHQIHFLKTVRIH
nr:hypothetical protein [Tanacetum cinerariifolium]